MQIVQPSALGSCDFFSKNFITTIMDGQYRDSNDSKVSTMAGQTRRLNEMADGFIHRCDYSYLSNLIPQKYLYTLFFRLSNIQIELYKVVPDILIYSMIINHYYYH